MLKFIKRLLPEKVVYKQHPVPEYVVFNVDNFNNWYNDKNNGATYAHSGIFLRLDKLSESQILDYIEKCYGITNGGPFLWSKPTGIMLYDFMEAIRKDWLDKLSKLSV